MLGSYLSRSRPVSVVDNVQGQRTVVCRTQRCLTTCQAGFGKSSGEKKSVKKGTKLAKYLDVQQPSGTSSFDSDGWFQVPDVSVKNTFVSKPIKAVILESGKAICLFKVESTIYCTDANSTAFQYPLADASIIQLKNGEPAVEVKLDGTVYELATGRVVSWCPKNNPIRSVLGSLKDKSEPEDLPTYPVDIRGDDVWVNLSLS
jgi:nitrite reductase/ring-hydroxylating ferredoxin subunit